MKNNFSAIEIIDTEIDSNLLNRAQISLKTTRTDFKTILLNNKSIGLISYKSVNDDIKIEAIYSDIKNKGIASSAISSVIKNKSSFSFVEPSNTVSMHLHESLGFKKESQREIDNILYNVMYKTFIK